MITLLFGEVLERRLSLKEQEVTVWDSDITLSLEWAAWRIQRREHILCSSTSENGIDSQLERGAKTLEGKAVIRTALSKISYDLTLWFEEGYKIKVFCDQVNDVLRRNNYLVRYRKRIFVITSGSLLNVEERRA